MKNKPVRKILSILTIGVGGWFVFVFARGLIEPFINTPISSLIVGSVLVMIGINLNFD